MYNSFGLSLLRSGLLLLAVPAFADFSLSLEKPVCWVSLGTSIGNDERNVVVEALTTFGISSAGIWFRPMLGGTTDLRVNIWEVLPGGVSVWPYHRGALLATAKIGIDASQRDPVYDVPISFLFEQGKRYAIGFESVNPHGWGQFLNVMQFCQFDPAIPGYQPFVAGPVKVIDGGFGTDFKNRNFPTVRLSVVTEKLAWVPILINIYPHAGVTDDEARAAVAEASKILRQAGVVLVVMGTPIQTSEGDVGSDGIVDWDLQTPTPGLKEDDAMISEGQQELLNRIGGRGIKVSIVNRPKRDSALHPGEDCLTAGWTIRSTNVEVVRKQPLDAVLDGVLTGQTIAHEIGHLFSLGHTTNVAGDTGRLNLMAPDTPPDNCGSAGGFRAGAKLTATQIAAIKNSSGFRSTALLSSHGSAAKPDHQQYGAAVDATGDQLFPGSAYLDIKNVTLWSTDESPLIEGWVTLRGRIAGAPNTTSYVLAIDSDNNPSTGKPYQLVPGIDYVVEFRINTVAPFLDSVTGTVRRLSDGASWPLSPDPSIVHVESTFDADMPPVPKGDQIVFGLPKTAIGIASNLGDLPIGPPTQARQIPVRVFSILTGVVADDVSLTFDLNMWNRLPQLNTFADCVPVPGRLYHLDLTAFSPNAPFEVLIDDRLVSSGITDAGGFGDGTFLFPADLAITERHFLTAIDKSTGKFGYSMTCITP